jgi:Ca-activated chloride channel family protein
MRARLNTALGISMVLGLAAGCGAARDTSVAAAPEAPAGAARQMQPAYDEPLASSESKAAEAAPPERKPVAAPVTPAAPPPPVAAGAAARPDVAAAAPAKVAAKKDMPRSAATMTAAAPPPAPPAPPTAIVAAPSPEPPGTEHYRDYGVNPVVDPAKDRFSTFAIDVDTASYSIARRKILEGSLPPFASVRVEEFLNSFDYQYASPESGAFRVHLAAAPSPFTPGHHLVRVGVQGKRVSPKDRKPVHLVYLVDTSGSMQSADKIGLAKKSLAILTESLRPGDTVALCTYAGSVREVLPPTGVEQRSRILSAIEELTASGSTAMSSGIDLAYQLAARTRVPGHVNRVIVLSDGDANVGPTSHEELLRTIRAHRDQGITLSTVGFGMGNYKDVMMERLADSGDGNYSYIDSEAEAKKVFSDEVSGLLEVIARDVKIQVELDPAVVREYRLIGYENRDVADKDFRNDKVDAGEIGSGHDVTAVYDVVLKTTTESPAIVRVRHKAPLGSDKAEEQAFRLEPSMIAPTFDAAPADLRFVAAVAGFAEILRQSPAARTWRLADVERIAQAAAADRKDQQELIDLVRRARALSGESKVAVAR